MELSKREASSPVLSSFAEVVPSILMSTSRAAVTKAWSAALPDTLKHGMTHSMLDPFLPVNQSVELLAPLPFSPRFALKKLS